MEQTNRTPRVAQRRRSPAASGLRVALMLLAVSWLVLLIGLTLDARRGSPEPTLRRYLADLEAHDVGAALGALSPEAGERWRDFLDFQQFNRYEVVSVAVRSPSLLESMTTGQPWRPTQATMVVDISEPSGVRWRGSTVVPVTFVDGAWKIERPPFAPA